MKLFNPLPTNIKLHHKKIVNFLPSIVIQQFAIPSATWLILSFQDIAPFSSSLISLIPLWFPGIFREMGTFAWNRLVLHWKWFPTFWVLDKPSELSAHNTKVTCTLLVQCFIELQRKSFRYTVLKKSVWKQLVLLNKTKQKETLQASVLIRNL